VNVAPSSLVQGLEAGLQALGLDLSPLQRGQLLDYLALIQKWNRVYNLTALREPQEMLSHHLLDSLSVVNPVRRHAAGRGLRLLDVGSGAGLPGVVLAICCPELAVDCVDTVGKKAAFIQQVALTLKLPRLRGVHERAERLVGPYDLICSRAFASLADFVAGSGAALEGEGVWLAMKGKYPANEVASLPPEVGVFHVEPLEVPGLGAERCLLWLKRARPVT
jgi:16S rRNA (guanine527-N7)-methyltransferase